MPVLKMNASQFARFHAALAQGFQPALLRGLQAGAQRAVAYLVDRTGIVPPANPNGIGSGGAVNTGDFRRRWRARPMPDGVVISNDHPAGDVIEHGRRPGKMPPREPIARWAQRRLGVPSAEADRLGYVIARAIGDRGLIGRKILTAPEAQNRIAELVTREMIFELEREMKKRR